MMPVFSTPAPRLGECGKSIYGVSFTAPWNVLEYPAGTIPVTLVKHD